MDLNSIFARARWLPVAMCAALSLAACGGDEGEETVAAESPTPPPTSTPPPSGGGGTGNQAPTISGSPLGSTLYGRQYSFTPSATDANGDALTFSITGRPAWAAFDPATGRLRGTPTQADVGTYSNISISVTDGTSTASLASFSVQVVATATGSATLSWNPPTQNTDGTPLGNLAGYRVYYGTDSGSYPNSTVVQTAGVATFVVDQLTPATWYFVVTAVNTSGIESTFSNVASKTVL